MRLLIVFASLTALFVLACDSDSKEENKVEEILAQDLVAPEDIVAPEDALEGLLAFGAACTDGAECEDQICHEFGNGGSLCTMACEVPGDCPAGSDGSKCNNKGVCKP